MSITYEDIDAFVKKNRNRGEKKLPKEVTEFEYYSFNGRTGMYVSWEGLNDMMWFCCDACGWFLIGNERVAGNKEYLIKCGNIRIMPSNPLEVL